MDPIKVDFSRKEGNRQNSIVVPPERAALKIILSVVCSAVFAVILFYFMLPALNFKAIEFYIYFAAIAVSYIIFSAVFTKALAKPEYIPYVKKQAIIPGIIIAALVVVVAIGYVFSCQLFRAKDYSKIITVTEADFTEGVEVIENHESFVEVPRLDGDSANQIATRGLGDLAKHGLESQFKVSEENNNQINIGGKPTRVVPLEYDNIIKWFYNTKEGIPGYIKIDMSSMKQELVMLKDENIGNIRYSTSEHFKYNLTRHLRFEYPTYMFGDATFEIHDNGHPYWVCPVLDKTIGLFGGKDVKGIVLVDAVTGECKEYSIDDVKTNKDLLWIDHVYDSELVVEQYDYYGKYRDGFFNSLLGQKNVVATTEGYNYIAQNDDVWMYTGVTSVTGDNSLTGFVLVNQRTKETKFYEVAGGTESSAQNSAQGLVKDLQYTATFPVLLNIGGEPTYFMSLKDENNIVQQCALVNVRHYNSISTNNKDLSACLEDYLALLEDAEIKVDFDDDGIGQPDAPSSDDAPALPPVTGVIEDIRTAVIGGESYYYIKLAANETYFSFAAKDNQNVVILNKGDNVTITPAGDSKDAIVAAKSIKLAAAEPAPEAAPAE